MEIEKLENIVEAILFVSGNGISVAELTDALGLQKSEVNRALASLKNKYGGASGVRLLTYGGKIQFGTNPDYADSVAQILNPIQEKELSNAALETIAIVAYRQPVTRLDVEQIRGVNCDYSMQLLLKHNLIEVVGRKEAVGKPLLFGTTEGFLKRFQISGLSELPDYEELLERIKIIGEKKAETPEAKDSIYNEFEIPEEKPADEEQTPDRAEPEAKAEDPFAEEEIPEFLKGEENLKKIG